MVNPQSFIASGRDLTGYTKWLAMYCIIPPCGIVLVNIKWFTLTGCALTFKPAGETADPAETILPDGPDDPTLDGTDNSPILLVVPGDLDETDDDSDDDGPELPDVPAVPEDIDETDAP